MPQKKNPDSLELIRGKSARILGHLCSALTLVKGLPLAYNKDLQEDKELLFDTLDHLFDCLLVSQIVLKTLKLDRAVASNAVKKGFLNATDMADYLVRKGMPFRKAHELVGKLVLHCESQGIELQGLSLSEMQSFSSLIQEDVYPALTLDNTLETHSVLGGTAPTRVREALEQAETVLNAY